MTTGERMKQRRKEIGLSAEKVAERLGVSPATIYRYEKGDIEKVPGDSLAEIAKILRTTPTYLMGWDEEKEVERSLEKVKAALEQEDSQTAEIIKLVLDLPENKQAEALNYIRYLSEREGK